MKSCILSAVFSLMLVHAFSQSRINEVRQTVGYHQFYEYDRAHLKPKLAADGTKMFQDVDDGVRFTIEDDRSSPEYYIVYFWEFDKKQDPTSYYQLNYYNSGEARYFAILKSDLEYYSKKIYATFAPSIGAMTLPFKYRPQNGKFEKTFTMGLTAGVTWNPWKVNDHTFSLLAGIAASSVTVTKYTTDPGANVTDPTDLGAISFSLNFLYQWDRLQVGISAGIDNLFDNEVMKWKYQSKPWISFGIGIGLFTSNKINTPGGN